MNLFEIVDEFPVPSAEARTIKEFLFLIERDKSKKKETGLRELAFVYFFAGFSSRFEQYKNLNERSIEIAKAVGLDEKWKADESVKEAIKRYKFLIETRAMSLVRKMDKSIKKIEDFLEGVNLDERNKSENYVFEVGKLIDANNKIPTLLENLIKAQGIVAKEMQDKFGKAGRDISVVESNNQQVDKNRAT